MKEAIQELNEKLRQLSDAECTWRNAGYQNEADAISVKAAEIRQALAVLRYAIGGPIYPQPSCGTAGQLEQAVQAVLEKAAEIDAN